MNRYEQIKALDVEGMAAFIDNITDDTICNICVYRDKFCIGSDADEINCAEGLKQWLLGEADIAESD